MLIVLLEYLQDPGLVWLQRSQDNDNIHNHDHIGTNANTNHDYPDDFSGDYHREYNFYLVRDPG